MKGSLQNKLQKNAAEMPEIQLILPWGFLNLFQTYDSSVASELTNAGFSVT